MTAQDDRLKAMTFQRPEFIPVSVGLLPAAWMKYRDALDDIVRRHPIIFGDDPPSRRDYNAVARETFRPGDWPDEWGCVWSNVAEGMEGMVTSHPLPRRQDVDAFTAPDADTGLPHGFMYMRLFYLRGFEELMVDFAEQPPQLQALIDKVLAYNVRQMRNLLAQQTEAGRILGFGDDLGMQHALPISPAAWRKYLKGCYAKLYGMVRQAGHYVYMHSDGHFFEVIPDLIDCGVNVINPQFRANGLGNLAAVCKGKICVDLDLDRQMMPFCSPADLDAHVLEAVEALGSPAGGLWIKGEVGPDVPLENIEALCDALETHRAHFGN